MEGYVKKSQFSEAFPEAVIKEGADELTLSAEEVGSQRAFIDTKHIEIERWGPPLEDADWRQAKTKELKGKHGKSCIVMSVQRVEPGGWSQKSEESPKGESPLGNESGLGQEVRKNVIQLAKKIFWAGHEPAWNCGDNISKTRWRNWRRHCNVWRILTSGWHLVSQFVVASLVVAEAFQHRWREDFAKDVGRALLGGVWPCLDPWDVVRLRTSSSVRDVLGSTGRTASSSSSS